MPLTSVPAKRCNELGVFFWVMISEGWQMDKGLVTARMLELANDDAFKPVLQLVGDLATSDSEGEVLNVDVNMTLENGTLIISAQGTHAVELRITKLEQTEQSEQPEGLEDGREAEVEKGVRVDDDGTASGDRT